MLCSRKRMSPLMTASLRLRPKEMWWPPQPTATVPLPTATHVPIAGASVDIVPQEPPASCPVTQPPHPSFVPPQPALTASGRRRDGSAPPLRVSRATNAFHEDFKSAMLIGVDFPTLGCWEITDRYKGAELSFVVWVGP